MRSLYFSETLQNTLWLSEEKTMLGAVPREPLKTQGDE
jgi:hypothetical protein